MQWINVGLYHAKAIQRAKKNAIKAKRKATRKALVEAAQKALKPADIQAQVQILAATKARRQLGIKPVQFQPLPSYRKGMGKDFYQTREWKELRYSIIVKYGKKCQCCGSTDGYMHVDHIKPRSRYPELELDGNNLQILCEPCNIGKSNKDATDWR